MELRGRTRREARTAEVAIVVFLSPAEGSVLGRLGETTAEILKLKSVTSSLPRPSIEAEFQKYCIPTF